MIDEIGMLATARTGSSGGGRLVNFGRLSEHVNLSLCLRLCGQPRRWSYDEKLSLATLAAWGDRLRRCGPADDARRPSETLLRLLRYRQRAAAGVFARCVACEGRNYRDRAWRRLSRSR